MRQPVICFFHIRSSSTFPPRALNRWCQEGSPRTLNRWCKYNGRCLLAQVKKQAIFGWAGATFRIQGISLMATWGLSGQEDSWETPTLLGILEAEKAQQIQDETVTHRCPEGGCWADAFGDQNEGDVHLDDFMYSFCGKMAPRWHPKKQKQGLSKRIFFFEKM